MATYAEQIAGWEHKLAANIASMKAIMDKSADDGATLDASQKEDYDNLAADNVEIEDHLKRLRPLEKANLATAKEVKGESGSDTFRVATSEDVRSELCKKLVDAGHGVLQLSRAERELESIFLKLVQGGKDARN